MTRSQVREIVMHISFAQSANPRPVSEVLEQLLDRDYYASLGEEDELYLAYPSAKQIPYLRQMAEGISEHLVELDFYIEKYAKGWKISRISRVAMAIMRVSMYEVLYMQDIPGGVAINEAVEIAKHYEDTETVSFINGILGSFIRTEMPGLEDALSIAPSAPEVE